MPAGGKQSQGQIIPKNLRGITLLIVDQVIIINRINQPTKAEQTYLPQF
ncbi:11752_t:CDS:2 [Funneliformis mosseae]|uniref:11752_t:CDS:1 n=1 Tax=Funneliformis mosseae TaxID=27381 RepID=A0A9N9AL98_FUNMO|nr:11752_t:CDS:2 [Funneliformis mosseae]